MEQIKRRKTGSLLVWELSSPRSKCSRAIFPLKVQRKDLLQAISWLVVGKPHNLHCTSLVCLSISKFYHSIRITVILDWGLPYRSMTYLNNGLHLQWFYFQIRLLFERLDLWTWGWSRRHKSPDNTTMKWCRESFSASLYFNPLFVKWRS